MIDLLETTLTEAQFEGVTFPVVNALETEGGHSLVEHKAYGRRGADVEKTGQDPYVGTITAALINGLLGSSPNLYPQTYTDLIDAFEAHPIGVLWHPSKGRVTAGIKKWKERFDPDVRNGCFLDIQWVEHNATAQTLVGPDNAPTTDSTQRATSQAQSADAAMAATGSVYTPVTPVITAQLGVLGGAGLTALQITSAINTMSAAVQSNLALAGFAAITALDAALALETLRATINSMRIRFLGAQANTKLVTLPVDMPLWRVAQWQYRDSSLGSLILAANSIANPNLIRAGTTLVILPE